MLKKRIKLNGQVFSRESEVVFLYGYMYLYPSPTYLRDGRVEVFSVRMGKRIKSCGEGEAEFV
jgi:hypothetical protein